MQEVVIKLSEMFPGLSSLTGRERQGLKCVREWKVYWAYNLTAPL